MLEGLIFMRPFRTLMGPQIIHFLDPVTLLVGDQGAGKSTLIELIRAITTRPETQDKLWQSIGITQEEARTIIAPFSDRNDFHLWARDFERDGQRYRTDIAPDEQGGLSLQMAALKMSHGQANRHILEGLGKAKIAQSTLFLLDEPDAALSPRSCYDLVRLFRKLAAQGHQVIAAVHNPIVIQGHLPEDPTSGWARVYDLETFEFTPPDTYLEAQSRPAIKKPTSTR